MLAAYAIALLICAASVVLGTALRALAGERRPSWLAAPVGFATLVVAAPLLIQLPGRATTAAIVLLVLLIAATIATVCRTDWPPWRAATGARHHGWWIAPVAVAIVIAVASLPFLFNDQFGVLGEGIYTNDHAQHLYWADWLRTGIGPEPDAVQFGYPVGPQALAATAAEATGADLVEAFNGLLLAIPALTALTALALLGGLRPERRVLAASLVALPYLGASFLAQSAFKETVMALLVVAFAIALGDLGRSHVSRPATLLAISVLALGALFTYSAPGLAWFAATATIWLGLELLAGRRPVALAQIRAAIARHRAVSALAALAALALAALAVGPLIAFFERIETVQGSVGRLGSPVFPGEALGVWPADDFRLVRGDVTGAIPAALVGLAALAAGVWALIRRGETALLAALAAAAGIYVGSRWIAEIHVQAKALAVMAPLVMLISLRALLANRGSGESRGLATGRLAFGALFTAAAVLSTLGALRAAPVGFDERAVALERLGDRIETSSVVFLGLDRFAAYRLRGTEVRSPGGFVPPRVNARSRKPWQQGQSIDFDTLSPTQLDQFDYAITTAAAYQSTPPPNMRRVAAEGDYVLWERTGPTPDGRVLPGERGDPGAILECERQPPRRRFHAGTRATLISEPVVADPGRWRGVVPVDPRDAAAGQEDAFLAPARVTQRLDLAPGRWRLSLQYHSQVPLVVDAPGEPPVDIPPSLEGMYLDGAGQGAYWPVGEVAVPRGRAGPTTIAVRATAPSALQDALDVPRRVWLGRLAAMPVSQPRTVPIVEACSRYVDRVLLPPQP